MCAGRRMATLRLFGLERKWSLFVVAASADIVPAFSATERTTLPAVGGSERECARGGEQAAESGILHGLAVFLSAN